LAEAQHSRASSNWRMLWFHRAALLSAALSFEGVASTEKRPTRSAQF
jgi:hypothetical protein